MHDVLIFVQIILIAFFFFIILIFIVVFIIIAFFFFVVVFLFGCTSVSLFGSFSRMAFFVVLLIIIVFVIVIVLVFLVALRVFLGKLGACLQCFLIEQTFLQQSQKFS